MQQIRYSVPGMTCSHCEDAVSAELAKLPGVAGVVVDLERKTVEVSGEPIDDAAVRAAIAEAGYAAA